MKKFLFSAAICLLAFQVQAAETRYSTWSDPNKVVSPADSNLQKMVDELRKLVDEAAKARAADPVFLKDLNSLLARYDVSVPVLLWSDNFSDGDFLNNPQWTVVSGKYWIEKGYGLRSFVDQNTPSTGNSASQSRKVSKEELLIGVLGAVLGAKNQSQTQQKEAVAPAQETVQAAEIYAHQTVSNAFVLEMDLASWIAGGQVEFGPYQDSKRQTGYRLIYQSGQTPALQLVRKYSNSTSVLATYKDLVLEDRKMHKLVWSRDQNGRIRVQLDQTVLMDVVDQGFRDDFAGFVLSNKSGDFTLQSISVSK